jgi:hypothetical protein
MWIMTTRGFLSAVEDPENRDRLVVRGRVRADVEEAAAACAGASPVEDTPRRDYGYRTRVPKAAFGAYVAMLAERIDYGNFKDAVAERQGYKRAQVYSGVWGTLLGLIGIDRAAPDGPLDFDLDPDEYCPKCDGWGILARSGEKCPECAGLAV